MALAAFSLMQAAANAAAPGDSAKLLANDADGTNWASYGRTYSEDHASPLHEIDSGNVGRLGLAWSLELPDIHNGATVPLAVDGVVYFTVGQSIVHAVDAQSGRLLWRHDPEVTKVAGRKLRITWGPRGIAYWAGKIYVGTTDGRLIALVDLSPIDVGHEGIDIRSGGRAEVQVVGVLEHVECEDRNTARHRIRVIGGPLVHQRSLARKEGQQHPARAPTERFAHRDELRAPAVDASEVRVERQGHRRHHGPTVRAQRVEVQLVQQHRVRRDELFTLQAVELEAGRGGEVDRRKLGADDIQPLHGAGVVVGVVAGDKALGEAVERAGGKAEGTWREIHGIPPVVIQACVING